MYLDTDVVLAELKVEDWLASAVAVEALSDPVTSVATCIEVNYVMEGEWNRERLTRVPSAITDAGIELVPLEANHLERGGALQRRYDRLNYFDAVHLGTARAREETIVSTDGLYPDIEEVDAADPRDV